MSYHYGVPPNNYGKFYDSSSPYSSHEFVQYTPYSHDSTPLKQHSRKPSHNSSPRVGGWFSPAGSPPPYHGANVQYATPRKEAYVSVEKNKPSTRYSYRVPGTKEYTPARQRSAPVFVYEAGDDYERPLAEIFYREPQTPPRPRHGRKPSADVFVRRKQEQIYEDSPRRSTRPRRSSSTTKPPPTSKASAAKSASHATEDDAARAGIPGGYSIKNWDPTELPIILLGSVFDANSLGKWIYDWTVYHHGAATPMADMAGDLWLLLIKLAGKMKRAEECIRRIRSVDNQEMVDDFIVSGGRLWEKFKGLLKDCEYYMMKAAKREGTKTMGKNAGTEFVDSIFGRDRHLEETEQIMNNIRLWNMRFDVNCEEILRRPSAA